MQVNICPGNNRNPVGADGKILVILKGNNQAHTPETLQPQNKNPDNCRGFCLQQK